MEKTLEERKGITLIALVITIIVLLILAGVSIAMLTGDNGILTQANNAKIETRGAAVEEAKDLWKQENLSASETGGNSKELSVLLDELENQNLLIGNERQTIETTGKVEIGSRIIDFGTTKKIKLDAKIIESYGEIDGRAIIRVEIRYDYLTYALDILEGKTEKAKNEIFIEGFNYKESQNTGKQFETVEEIFQYFKDEGQIDKVYSNLEDFAREKGFTTNDFLIANKFVKPKEYIESISTIVGGTLKDSTGKVLELELKDSEEDVLQYVYADYIVTENGEYSFSYVDKNKEETKITVKIGPDAPHICHTSNRRLL